MLVQEAVSRTPDRLPALLVVERRLHVGSDLVRPGLGRIPCRGCWSDDGEDGDYGTCDEGDALHNSLTVHAIVDDALSPAFPLGVELALFTRHEDAERFIEEVRGADPDVASKLGIEERELGAGPRD